MGSFIKRLALSPAVGGKKSVITELFAVVGRGQSGGGGGGREREEGCGEGRAEGAGGRGAPAPDPALSGHSCLHTSQSVVLWWLRKAKESKFKRQLLNKQYNFPLSNRFV